MWRDRRRSHGTSASARACTKHHSAFQAAVPSTTIRAHERRNKACEAFFYWQPSACSVRLAPRCGGVSRSSRRRFNSPPSRPSPSKRPLSCPTAARVTAKAKSRAASNDPWCNGDRPRRLGYRWWRKPNRRRSEKRDSPNTWRTSAIRPVRSSPALRTSVNDPLSVERHRRKQISKHRLADTVAPPPNGATFTRHLYYVFITS